MFKSIGKLCLLLTAICINCNAVANNNTRLSIDWYKGSGEVDGIRLGYVPYILKGNEILPNSQFFEDSEISFEVAVAHWRQSQRDETVSSLIFTPTFRHYFYKQQNLSYFWELGIGLAIHDADKIERRVFGSHFNFEDHVGVGLGYQDTHFLTLRYFHYSNANLHFPNTGIDFFSINYRYSL